LHCPSTLWNTNILLHSSYAYEDRNLCEDRILKEEEQPT
jgi:hypothetical protein